MKKYTMDTLIKEDPAIVVSCAKRSAARLFLQEREEAEETVRKCILCGIAGVVVTFFACFLMGPVRFNAMF